jgi:hypothetical protein
MRAICYYTVPLRILLVMILRVWITTINEHSTHVGDFHKLVEIWSGTIVIVVTDVIDINDF